MYTHIYIRAHTNLLINCNNNEYNFNKVETYNLLYIQLQTYIYKYTHAIIIKKFLIKINRLK